jgi:hypothetical protein
MTDSTLYADFKTVTKAVKGDSAAFNAIEAKYGRMKTKGDLQLLGIKLYTKLTIEERNMICLQVELALQTFMRTKGTN